MNEQDGVCAIHSNRFPLANVSGGDWGVASNWNPTLVPLSNDNARITQINAIGTVTNSTECLSLFLGDPTLNLSNVDNVNLSRILETAA